MQCKPWKCGPCNPQQIMSNNNNEQAKRVENLRKFQVFAYSQDSSNQIHNLGSTHFCLI